MQHFDANFRLQLESVLQKAPQSISTRAKKEIPSLQPNDVKEQGTAFETQTSSETVRVSEAPQLISTEVENEIPSLQPNDVKKQGTAFVTPGTVPVSELVNKFKQQEKENSVRKKPPQPLSKRKVIDPMFLKTTQEAHLQPQSQNLCEPDIPYQQQSHLQDIQKQIHHQDIQTHQAQQRGEENDRAEELISKRTSVAKLKAEFVKQREDNSVKYRPQQSSPQDRSTTRQKTSEIAQFIEAKLNDPNRKSITLRGLAVTRQADSQGSQNFIIPMSWTDELTEYLDLTTPEAISITSRLNESLGMSTLLVKKIERIQNRTLYQLYLIQKEAMDKANGSHDNERILWHGTSCDAIHNINNNGFNRSYCGKNATVYGEGVYFARDASYSLRYSFPDPEGARHMYVAKVLSGIFATGSHDMRDTPIRVSENSLHYDSVVNTVNDPSIFVIFKDHAAYPEYLITFTS